MKRTIDYQQQPEGIILYRNGVVLDLDDETAAIFGYERHELIGRALSELLPEYPSGADASRPPEITIGFLDGPRDAATAETAHTRRTAARSKDGVLFPVALDRGQLGDGDSLPG